jgi:hypothetical protein
VTYRPGTLPTSAADESASDTGTLEAAGDCMPSHLLASIWDQLEPTAGGQPTQLLASLAEECKALQQVLGSAISACSVRVCNQMVVRWLSMPIVEKEASTEISQIRVSPCNTPKWSHDPQGGTLDVADTDGLAQH